MEPPATLRSLRDSKASLESSEFRRGRDQEQANGFDHQFLRWDEANENER